MSEKIEVYRNERGPKRNISHTFQTASVLAMMSIPANMRREFSSGHTNMGSKTTQDEFIIENVLM